MPDIPSFPSREQLDRYLAGELPPDEGRRVAQWIAQDDRRHSAVEALKHLDHPRRNVDRDPLGMRWPQLASHIVGSSFSGTRHRAPRQHPLRRPWLIQPVLGVFACLVIGMTAWRLIGNSDRAGTAASFNRADRVYATNVGQRATVTLDDGSRVTLAPQTTLRVTHGFGRSSRAVSLTGEALFEVRTAAQTPFTVRTGNVTTHVLGTVFAIKHYATDLATRVVVSEGKVQSVGPHHAGAARAVVLTSGMIGFLTDSTATTAVTADVSAYTEWTRGHLDFHNTPVSEVLGTMERWYGVRFHLADSSLMRETVTGSLDFHTTSAALSYLQSLLGVQMTFEATGDTTIVTLRSRGTTKPSRVAPRDAHSFKPRTEVGR